MSEQRNAGYELVEVEPRYLRLVRGKADSPTKFILMYNMKPLNRPVITQEAANVRDSLLDYFLRSSAGSRNMDLVRVSGAGCWNVIPYN